MIHTSVQFQAIQLQSGLCGKGLTVDCMDAMINFITQHGGTICMTLRFPFFSKPFKYEGALWPRFFGIFGTRALTRDVSNRNQADKKLISDHC